MKRTLSLLCCFPVCLQAAELQPLFSLQGLFRDESKGVETLIRSEDRVLRSEIDLIEGGINQNESGAALFSLSQERESFACMNDTCEQLAGATISQDRGGLAWNMGDADGLRVSPKAEVIRYSLTDRALASQDSDLGLGVGVDSIYRFGEGLSAYARTGMMQFEQRNGFESTVGIFAPLRRGRIFLEARWADMTANDRTQLNQPDYEENSLRIGFSRAFKGL